MEQKQSSVDCIFSHIKASRNDINYKYWNDSMLVNWILDQEDRLKTMHKEEIVDANFYGQRLHAKSVTNTMMEDNAYEYYNETFNTK